MHLMMQRIPKRVSKQTMKNSKIIMEGVTYKIFTMKKTLIILLVVVSLPIVYLALILVTTEKNIYNPAVFGSDTYHHFGDGRFEIGNMKNDRKVPFDIKNNTSLIYDLIKYREKGDEVYLTGYYSQSSSLSSYFDPHEEVRKWYEDGSNVFYYTILNYRTGEVEWYRTLDEMPSEDMKIFEKGNNPFCYIMRTCWEKKE